MHALRAVSLLHVRVSHMIWAISPPQHTHVSMGYAHRIFGVLILRQAYRAIGVLGMGN
jgi:hypothetical protein